MIIGVASILAIDNRGHPLQGLPNLRFGADVVPQPVADVLARDPKRRTVFHQPDVVDIRHLGTTDALIDPAHHVAQDTLGVVVKLLLDLF